MAIGAYRHRIRLENPGPPVMDGYGGYTDGWLPLNPVEADGSNADASIEAASARDLERITAGTVAATATHLVRMRFHPDVTTNTRIVFRDRVLEIQSVQNVEERDIALILICAERRDDMVTAPAAVATVMPVRGAKVSVRS
jgi:head-tail adaptor